MTFSAGLTGAWRAPSVAAGFATATATAVAAALVSLGGSLALLAAWHDPQALAAIDRSGGLGEVFALPWMLLLPAAMFGTVGGLIGAAARRVVGAGH